MKNIQVKLNVIRNNFIQRVECHVSVTFEFACTITGENVFTL